MHAPLPMKPPNLYSWAPLHSNETSIVMTPPLYRDPTYFLKILTLPNLHTHKHSTTNSPRWLQRIRVATNLWRTGVHAPTAARNVAASSNLAARRRPSLRTVTAVGSTVALAVGSTVVLGLRAPSLFSLNIHPLGTRLVKVSFSLHT